MARLFQTHFYAAFAISCSYIAVIPTISAQVSPAIPAQVSPAIPAQVFPVIPAQVSPVIPAQAGIHTGAQVMKQPVLCLSLIHI